MTTRVALMTLTDTPASEHFYMSELRQALTDQDVFFVDDWQSADVVHLFEVNVFTRSALKTGRFLRLVRVLLSDTPLVVSTDDLYFIGRPELTARPRLYWANHHLQRLLFDRADAIIAISNSVHQALSTALSEPDSIHVVHHGVGEEYFATGADGDQTRDEQFVLHVSLASKRKNPEAVLAVCRRLDERVVLAGSGWQDRVPNSEEYANVETTGYLPESELVELYHRAPIFYFPTRHEGFGLPVLEAMAASTAIVTTDSYSVPEVAGDTAVLHDPDDVTAHVRSLEDLLSNRSRRRTLATRARKRAAEFTWEAAATETSAVYLAIQ